MGCGRSKSKKEDAVRERSSTVATEEFTTPKHSLEKAGRMRSHLDYNSEDVEELRSVIEQCGSLQEIETLEFDVDRYVTAEDYSDDEAPVEEAEYDSPDGRPRRSSSPRSSPKLQDLSDAESSVQKFREIIQKWIGPENATAIGAHVPAVPRQPIDEMPQCSFCGGKGDMWNVRRGPDYDRNGKKAPSQGAMYAAIGMDLFSSDSPIYDVGSKLRIPVLPYKTNSPHAAPIFILNIQLPLAKPSMFGQKTNGKTVNIVLVFGMTPETAAAFEDRERMQPCHKLLEEWSEKAFEDKNFRGRFKVMAKVPHGVPTALSRFNGKPALVTGSGKVFKGPGYIEMDCNVSCWCYLARVSLYGMWSTIKEQCGDFAFTIESRENEHMPEKIVGCVQFSRLDLDTAPEWPYPVESL